MVWNRVGGAYSSLSSRQVHDIYPTPACAVRAILREEALHGPVWEPACGFGHISQTITALFPKLKLYSSDLIDHGFGTVEVDFLTTKPVAKFKTIITNPPYSLLRQFIDRARSIAPKVIMLARLEFTSGVKRASWFVDDPPTRIWVHSDAVPFYRIVDGSGHWEKGGNFRHAWWIWDATAEKHLYTQLRWLPDRLIPAEAEP